MRGSLILNITLGGIARTLKLLIRQTAHQSIALQRGLHGIQRRVVTEERAELHVHDRGDARGEAVLTRSAVIGRFRAFGKVLNTP